MRKGFTLIELLVVIAVLAVLAVVVILTLNPAGLFQEFRDSSRVSDMATLNSAISDFSADVFTTGALGNANTIYVSIPDPTATTTAGDQCQGLGLLTLPAGYTYQCAASSTYRLTNGTGWIPINFNNATFGVPFSELPTDPTNTSSSRLYYTYETNGQKFEMTSAMESAKYQLGGSSDVISGDGGTLASVYEKGSITGLEPLDYGDPTLAGYWALDEGQGSIAYDDSGNNATGSWSGTLGNQYSTNAKVGSYAGNFNGSNNLVTIPASSTIAINAMQSFTMAVWINTTVTGKDAFGARSTGTLDLQVLSGGQIRVTATDGTNSAAIASSALVNDGNWHFIVGVLDRSAQQLRLYVDNVSQGTPQGISTVGSLTGIGGFNIGSQKNIPYYLWNGLIDDVRIYNRVLSAAQIAAMYNGGK
jgi:prepilin-type N-terminal cleavage/methylation domain-containing protein